MTSKLKAQTLPSNFWELPTLEVARGLLGKQLHRQGFEQESFFISEVEAYTQDDPACHAYKGKTKRCEIMFGPPGFAYVYFIYGMYHCLNLVTEREGVGEAVLIRGLFSRQRANLDGPGKICRSLGIDLKHNGESLANPESPIWIGGGIKVDPESIISTERIGITKAKERPWRFLLSKEGCL